MTDPNPDPNCIAIAAASLARPLMGGRPNTERMAAAVADAHTMYELAEGLIADVSAEAEPDAGVKPGDMQVRAEREAVYAAVGTVHRGDVRYATIAEFDRDHPPRIPAARGNYPAEQVEDARGLIDLAAIVPTMFGSGDEVLVQPIGDDAVCIVVNGPNTLGPRGAAFLHDAIARATRGDDERFDTFDERVEHAKATRCRGTVIAEFVPGVAATVTFGRALDALDDRLVDIGHDETDRVQRVREAVQIDLEMQYAAGAHDGAQRARLEALPTMLTHATGSPTYLAERLFAGVTLDAAQASHIHRLIDDADASPGYVQREWRTGKEITDMLNAATARTARYAAMDRAYQQVRGHLTDLLEGGWHDATVECDVEPVRPHTPLAVKVQACINVMDSYTVGTKAPNPVDDTVEPHVDTARMNELATENDELIERLTASDDALEQANNSLEASERRVAELLEQAAELTTGETIERLTDKVEELTTDLERIRDAYRRTLEERDLARIANRAARDELMEAWNNCEGNMTDGARELVDVVGGVMQSILKGKATAPATPLEPLKAEPGKMAGRAVDRLVDTLRAIREATNTPSNRDDVLSDAIEELIATRDRIREAVQMMHPSNPANPAEVRTMLEQVLDGDKTPRIARPVTVKDWHALIHALKPAHLPVVDLMRDLGCIPKPDGELVTTDPHTATVIGLALTRLEHARTKHPEHEGRFAPALRDGVLTGEALEVVQASREHLAACTDAAVAEDDELRLHTKAHLTSELLDVSAVALRWLIALEVEATIEAAAQVDDETIPF